MSKVGFIGLGIMGAPMARNLRQAGHALFLHSRSGMKDRVLLEGGASECASPRAVAAAAEIIIVMVPDAPDVERVLFGTNGVAAGLTSGKIVVDMSSISPLATKEFARRIREECACAYLDAPVSGGEVGAKAGSLTIMVGGEAEVFERVRPLFDVMGKNITLVGGNGDGQTCKVANQIIVALTIEAIGEALVLAEGWRRPCEGAGGVDGRLRLLPRAGGPRRADDRAYVQSRFPGRKAGSSLVRPAVCQPDRSSKEGKIHLRGGSDRW
jgi:2-hydroxy-3-oxopropionate reductase